MVDDCQQCGGFFLDKGELQKVTGNRFISKALKKYPKVDVSKGFSCSHCGKKMERIPISWMEIDFCTDCRGLWLDLHELDGMAKVKGKRYLSKPLSQEEIDKRYKRDQDYDEWLMATLSLFLTEYREEKKCQCQTTTEPQKE